MGIFEKLGLRASIKRQDSLIFEITQRCNNDCIYCYNVWKNSLRYPSGEIATENIKTLLAKAIKESGCRQITISGGEPLLRDDLPDIISFICEKNCSVGMISNGTLYDEKTAKEHIKLGVSIFELPLLSAEREIHNRLCRRNTFDKVTEAIANIKLHGGIVIVVFVGTKLNIDGFENMVELSLGLGADGIMFNRFNVGGEGTKHIDELLPSIEQVRQALDSAEELSQKYKVSISCSIAIQPCLIDTTVYENLSFGYCAAGTDRAYYTIDSLGNLRMCNHTPSIIGNLFEESFARLTSKDRITGFMEKRPAFCNGCPMEMTCLGGCKAAAEACYGSLSMEEPFLALNKNRAVIPNRVINKELIVTGD
jgi:radical SAM protein with 4Fe4S-binding SPASM domain